jgi:hypothetical protein
MTRTQFQELTAIRLEDAEVLLTANRFDGAYYFLGHVIQAALKACVARRFPSEILPREFFTHDLNKPLAGTNSPELTSKLEDPRPAPDGQSLSANWAIVLYWDIGVRYERVLSSRAEGMYQAVADPVYRVLQCLKSYW